jgi:hypothetical protein
MIGLFLWGSMLALPYRFIADASFLEIGFAYIFVRRMTIPTSHLTIAIHQRLVLLADPSSIHLEHLHLRVGVKFIFKK